MSIKETKHHCTTMESLTNLPRPQAILLFSGKRKSGKDFITNALYERTGPEKSTIIKISGPIKSHWADSLGLDMDQLVGDGKYKEKYRLEMAKWGEQMRKKDYGYFCRAAIDMYNAQNKPIWIVSDIRRKTDILWFTENFGGICKTIRIVSDDLVRKERGWAFVPGGKVVFKLDCGTSVKSIICTCDLFLGIDDSETECDLDDISTWDLQLENNSENIESVLQKVLDLINEQK